MMSRKLLLLALILTTVLLYTVEGKRQKPREKVKPAKPNPKPPKLNTDALPTLPEILTELDINAYMPQFIRNGITETRLLLRLSNMDYQLMTMEWDMPEDKVALLKDMAAAMYIKAIVTEEVQRPELDARKKLKYGRMYLDNSVQNHEYILASFGGAPPIGKLQLKMDLSEFGCESGDLGDDHEGHIVFVRRGNCTFLEKAALAKRKNAAALIVVNSEDKLESPSSGLGVDRSIKEDEVLAIGDFPVIALANTSWAKLVYAVTVNAPASTFVTVVPLKCVTGGKCVPLLEEEKALQSEVSSGSMRLHDARSGQTRSFEFLTSNFGGNLPGEGTTTTVVEANPISGCTPLLMQTKGETKRQTPEQEEVEVEVEVVHLSSSLTGENDSSAAATTAQVTCNSTNPYKNAAVVVHRGGCRFHEKALHAQAAGARMLIIVDVEDNALQRVGGFNPEAGYVGIPSVIVTKHAGAFLTEAFSAGSGSGSSSSSSESAEEEGKTHQLLSMELSLSATGDVAEMWIELAYTMWEEEDKARLMQLEGLIQKFSTTDVVSNEIVLWLQRKRDELANNYRKNMDTDA